MGLIAGQGQGFVRQGQHFMGLLGEALAQHQVHQHNMRDHYPEKTWSFFESLCNRNKKL